MRFALALAGLLAVLPVSGCFSGRKGFEVEQDPGVLAFAERIRSFYDAIEEIPLDVELTYGKSDLRTYFASEGEFASYYAGLAAQLRAAQLRNATLTRVSIVEFRFEGDSVARVDLRLIGRHERQLRFGQLELPRQDTWQRRDGRWMVTPDKL
jgi:hypothetical protein